MGHNYIGTEHILLALPELEDGTGSLAGLGVTKARAERTIVATMDTSIPARVPIALRRHHVRACRPGGRPHQALLPG
jgi:hypothetical protein